MCIYCGLRPGDTDDHVPAKCLFDFPMHTDTQRITVPCCEVCRRSGESDEAPVRNILISIREAESHPTAVKLAAKRDRAFRKDSSQLKKVTDHMCIVGVQTPQGQVAKDGFNLESPLMERFILRMCRAILHQETASGFVKCSVRWGVNPERELREELLSGAKARVISDEFAYAGIFFPGEPVSMWLLNFYQSVEFFAVLTTE